MKAKMLINSPKKMLRNFSFHAQNKKKRKKYSAAAEKKVLSFHILFFLLCTKDRQIIVNNVKLGNCGKLPKIVKLKFDTRKLKFNVIFGVFLCCFCCYFLDQKCLQKGRKTHTLYCFFFKKLVCGAWWVAGELLWAVCWM